METKKTGERRGVPLSVRVAKPIYDELRAAQEKADDKSLTQTVERLLNQALRDERRAGDLLSQVLELRYGRDVARVLLGVATALETEGVRAFLATEGHGPEGRWPKHPYAFDRAIKGAQRALNFFRPKG
jgi:hypothetical protein